MGNLDRSIIEHLSQDDVKEFMAFFEAFLAGKYKSQARKHELLSVAKLGVDDIATKDIVTAFEKMLTQDPPESKWRDFLKKNLFLLDSKYIDVLPELSVVLATARKADFGLVDSQGYLDVFEIKRPGTPLLAKSLDRGNYYWSSDAVKAIMQAEKYLVNAESKAAVLAKDIWRERDVSVKVIRPRAVVVMGESSQLDNNAKHEDFRVLRMSLKNVEVLLYDELLARLKHQASKVYIE
jgi:hypothetical protein